MRYYYKVITASNIFKSDDEFISVRRNINDFTTLDKVKKHVYNSIEDILDDEFIIAQRECNKIYPCNFDAFMKLNDWDGEELFIFEKSKVSKDNPRSFENPIMFDDIYKYISIKKHLV